MFRTRAQAAMLGGMLCLLGQGALLYLAGRGPEAPELPWRWGFVALSLALSVVGAWRARCRAQRSAAIALVASAVALAVFAAFFPGGAVPNQPAVPAVVADGPIAQAASRLEAAGTHLEDRAVREASLLPGPDSVAGRGGGLFRLISTLPTRWASTPESGGMPLAAVVWLRGERVAWTAGAVPIDLPAADDPTTSANPRLASYRDRWFLSRFASGIGGHTLELQLQLPLTGSSWLATMVDVGPSGARGFEVDLDGDASAFAVHLRTTPELGAASSQWLRARLLGSMLVLWAVALIAGARLLPVAGLWLAALWAGRFFLGAVDLRRWVVAAFPNGEFPTAPGSWLSLIDPAYFATPVLGGWFASTADALLTSLLVAVSVRQWLKWRRLLAPPPEPAVIVGGSHRSWRDGLWLGIAAGLFLPVLQWLAELLAVNANPRLIGPAAALTSLTFWGLHVVLLLFAFSALCVLASVAMMRAVKVPESRRTRLAGAALSAAIAGALSSLLMGSWSGPGLLAALIASAIWVGAPILRRPGSVARHFVWPTLVMLAALWNYTSLRHVHERAERSWLEGRAASIADTNADWTRFLMQSVLAEMRQLDVEPAATPAGDLWRDEAAWRLYRDSALRDLGYACLVEIMNADEQTTSLFATGYLRDDRYETLSRSSWTTAEAGLSDVVPAVVFQTERRLYSGGEEEILVAESPRTAGRGWLRVEAPLRSWRLATVRAYLTGSSSVTRDRYHPRAEVDRPVLMLLADDSGWLSSGPEGFPGPDADGSVAALRSGLSDWAEIPLGGVSWLCRWMPLPVGAARTAGEGFVLGIRRPTAGETLLDFSRLLLIDLVAFFVLAGALQLRSRWTAREAADWRPGFQEKFLAGYLVLGLVLLLVVGMSVDRVGYERVRGEARQQARDGLASAVSQLSGLLADQARALADSDDMDALLRGQLKAIDAGLGGMGRQATLFRGDGTVLFEGSRIAFEPAEASAVLRAARASPMVLTSEDGQLSIGVVVPVDLGVDVPGLVGGPAPDAAGPGHGGVVTNGFFFYRQRLDAALVAGLLDALQGEVTLSLEGAAEFASHPDGLFSGERPPLLNPDLMSALLDHPQGPGLASPFGRPFAFDAAQPLPAFARGEDGHLTRRAVPAVLGVSFPGREREFAAQRRSTVLFLAGLATLILVTALLLALLMAWNLFRPLRVLMTATRSLAQGDYAAPLPDPGNDEVGRLSSAFGVMRSRLLHARDDLAARERFLATVLERVPVGVAVIAPDGSMVVVNPAGRAILDLVFPGEPFPEATRRLCDGIRSGTAAGISAAGEFTSGNGRMTLRGSVAPLDQGTVAGDLMVVFEDVSEFLATKKLALNAELARQVAHEIKNPLTPIKLSIQLLGQAWEDQHPQLAQIVPQTVERILDQVDLLRRIASEFSLLGRPDELPLGPVDLPALVARVVGAYVGAGLGQASHDGFIFGTPPADLPPVLAHEESLVKILGNLMQNSLDAARPGVDPVIETDWRLDGDQVSLVWRDNGTGLLPDVADRLFEPYFSTKSKGTGLGLAICRSLAERMGGTIRLSNRSDGPGAEAIMTLPLVAREIP